MPVDAHELIALVAPRPLLIIGGTQHQWADPKGEFFSLYRRKPVYKPLGKRNKRESDAVAPHDFDRRLSGIRGAYWPVFISFAELKNSKDKQYLFLYSMFERLRILRLSMNVSRTQDQGF